MKPHEPIRASASAPRLASLVAVLALAAIAAAATSRIPDPLAGEIARWNAWVADTSSKDELSVDARQSAGPLLAKADRAYADGRRWLALFRLAAVRGNMKAAEYAAARPAAREDLAAFEAEWRRDGSSLGRAPRVDGTSPAAVRAMAEVAALQSQGYYDASLDYGRSTAPLYGLYYLGLAAGQSDLARWLGTLPGPVAQRAIPLRSMAPEIERLQGRLLEAYRPPASIERHPEFITASAALKEARELDAAGLRHGALLKLLHAALRGAPLLTPAVPIDSGALEPRIAELERRLADGRDHSIADLFLQIAREDLALTGPGAKPAQAASVVSEVMPIYLAALAPAPARPVARAPRVTVTMVRWPYT